MKIEVLGPGCKNCDTLFENARKAVEELKDPNIDLKKVEDIGYFAKVGVFMTPGLVFDGKPVSTGKVLSVEQIKEKIKEYRS